MSLRARSGKAMAWVGAALASEREEIAVGIGAMLLAVGLWQWWPPAAFIAVGLVVLWVALPSRSPFVERPPAKDVSGRTH